ncbi:hypothetical protein E4U19_007621 [Claviceps sp. Clav32 group G5]|nr:hypothetical protein E4U19_007621 [Claviceps sp. Clav32 group G5]KAG6050436.1 hypothetical protein E4U39_004085 [Claviceps sp. Clav50 group G5]
MPPRESWKRFDGPDDSRDEAAGRDLTDNGVERQLSCFKAGLGGSIGGFEQRLFSFVDNNGEEKTIWSTRGRHSLSQSRHTTFTVSTPPSTISAHGSGRRPWQFAWLHSTHSELVGLANVLVSDSELALECSQLVAPDLSMTCSASQTQLTSPLGNSVAPGATARWSLGHAHRPIEQRRREEWPHLVRPL